MDKVPYGQGSSGLGSSGINFLRDKIPGFVKDNTLQTPIRILYGLGYVKEKFPFE